MNNKDNKNIKKTMKYKYADMCKVVEEINKNDCKNMKS